MPQLTGDEPFMGESLAELALELGLISRHRPRRQPEMPGVRFVVEGTEAIATTPEGHCARLPVNVLLDKVAAGQMGTGPLILPDGVKSVISQGNVTVWIWESPPRVCNFDWVTNDSPRPFGAGAKYRQVRLSLPYLVVLVTFGRNEAGLVDLLPSNECFFRNAPLKRLEDELCYPALLNCSKFAPPEGRPLSWICTQHLRRTSRMAKRDPAERFCGGFEALRHCLLETAFNYSSEHHESSSWFSESCSIDPRLQTVEAWEAASARDPLFVLDVPWLKTGFSVAQIVDRIFSNLQVKNARIDSASALARLVLNHK
jgi:hypothetical protein